MTYALGIDVGTTFTAGAVWRDGRAEAVSLGSHAVSVPSVLFLRDDGVMLVGEAAEARSVTEPSRVAREFKRRFGDEVPLLLGDSSVTATDLVADMIRFVVHKVSEREAQAPGYVMLTCPATWSDYRRGLMEKAAGLAGLGLGEVGLLDEPTAAAVYYAAQQRLSPGDVLAVYDLGGGTFDATVLRKTAGGFELLGEPGGDDEIGGVDVDQAVLEHVARAVGPSWYELDPADPATARALAAVQAAAVAAKEALSADVRAEIPVILPGVNTVVRISRDDLEDAVRILALRTVDALRRTVHGAGVQPTDLSRVLLVGGSSQIPMITRMIEETLRVPVVADAHPKLAVCLGAAIAAGPRLAALAPGGAGGLTARDGVPGGPLPRGGPVGGMSGPPPGGAAGEPGTAWRLPPTSPPPPASRGAERWTPPTRPGQLPADEGATDYPGYPSAPSLPSYPGQPGHDSHPAGPQPPAAPPPPPAWHPDETGGVTAYRDGAGTDALDSDTVARRAADLLAGHRPGAASAPAAVVLDVDLGLAGITAPADQPLRPAAAVRRTVRLADHDAPLVVSTGGDTAYRKAGRRTAFMLVGAAAGAAVIVGAVAAILTSTGDGTGGTEPGPVVQTGGTGAGALATDRVARLTGGPLAGAATAGGEARAAAVQTGGGLVAVGAAGSVDPAARVPTAWWSGDGASSPAAAVPLPLPAGSSTGTVSGLTLVDGRLLVAVGWVGSGTDSVAAAWTSTDGQRWQGGSVDGAPATTMRDVVVRPGGGLLAVGQDFARDGEGDGAVWTSADGLSWQRVTISGADGLGTQSMERVVTLADCGLLAVGQELSGAGTTARARRSADGVAWTAADTDLPDDAEITGLAQAGDGRLVATGSVTSGGSREPVLWVVDGDASGWEPEAVVGLDPGTRVRLLGVAPAGAVGGEVTVIGSVSADQGLVPASWSAALDQDG